MFRMFGLSVLTKFEEKKFVTVGLLFRNIVYIKNGVVREQVLVHSEVCDPFKVS